MNPVAFIAARGTLHGFMHTIAGICPEVGARSKRTAVAGAAISCHFTSRASDHRAASCFVSRPGDDIDHTIDGIGTPDRRHGPADHFNALDLFHWHILGGPIYTRKSVVVDTAPIHQNQQLRIERCAKPAYPDGPSDRKSTR